MSQHVILTKDKNNSLTANPAAANNMSNTKSRSECTHAKKETFMISVVNSTFDSIQGQEQSGKWKNVLETALGLSNKTFLPLSF